MDLSHFNRVAAWPCRTEPEQGYTIRGHMARDHDGNSWMSSDTTAIAPALVYFASSRYAPSSAWVLEPGRQPVRATVSGHGGGVTVILLPGVSETDRDSLEAEARRRLS